MKDLIFKKCNKCGALVEVINDCSCLDCGIVCCGEQMKIVNANSVDASFEKHIPIYERNGEEMIVSVNHVMEEEHFIEWILIQTKDGIYKKNFNPGDVATITVPYDENAILYSYCNKHGLWKKQVN